MRIYLSYFPKYRAPFMVAVTCVALEAFCDLLGPTLMARVVNYGILGEDMGAVLRWCMIMLLVVFVGACFAVTRSILAARVSSRLGADIRRDVFRKILSFSEESADKIQSGSLITRMTGDTAQVTLFANGIMRIFLKAPITCVGSIILATILNPRLSIVIYGVVAVIAVLTIISIKMSYVRFARLQKALDRVNSVTQEYLLGIRLVKAFGTYQEEGDRFELANENLQQRAISTQMVITVISPIMGLAVGLGATVAIYFGSVLFQDQLIEPGDVAAFVAYMSHMLMSLMMITSIFYMLVRAKASAARIQEVMDSEEDFASGEEAPATGGVVLATSEGVSATGEVVPASGEAVPTHGPAGNDPGDVNVLEAPGLLARLDGSLRFDNVTFTYPGGSGIPAISDLSFSVSPGETLAVIGPTGSGKSTICWLIMRFYDTDTGSILIGGHDIKSLPADILRANIAIAPQKPLLFSGTIEENIRWGNEFAPDEAVREAARQVQAAGFIESMQDGYMSVLGRGGVNISGGQKQRVSMARALIKNAPLLLIDDATSALDSVTEAKVRAELTAYPGTKVVITQRCSAAMFADKILVLENGHACGFGSHSELMETSETYKEIWHSQIDSKSDGLRPQM